LKTFSTESVLLLLIFQQKLIDRNAQATSSQAPDQAEKKGVYPELSQKVPGPSLMTNSAIGICSRAKKPPTGSRKFFIRQNTGRVQCGELA
jgi:hypothetical protein